MRLPEQRLWQRASKHLRERKVWLERIENVLGPGTPDVHGISANKKCYFWIENKAVVELPKRATTPLLGKHNGHSLNLEQINWHIEYNQRGGRSFVLIGIGSHRALLLPGALAPFINMFTLTESEAAALAIVNKPSDWDLVAEALQS